MIQLKVNGVQRSFDGEPDMPLLWYLRDVLALTGTKFPKKFTSHDLRRTVATRLAESLGDEGDKLVRRVLGHSDGSVTAIYNRYGYVREMRRALEQWANDLTSTHAPAQSLAAPALSRDIGFFGARAAQG